MIITRIHGGLGNQLFEYAAGRRLAHTRNTNLKLDISSLLEASTKRHFGLEFFNIQATIATPDEIREVNVIDTGRKKRLLWNFRHMFGVTPLYFFREKGLPFEPRILQAPDNTYLHGHWQSEKNFKDIEPILRSEFMVTVPQTGINAKMAQQITTSNAVSMHIRRTDYVSNETFSNIYNVCDDNYYKRAVQYISEKTKDPTFFIFSDDIAWAKANIRLSFLTVFVDINDDSKNFEDLRLMSQCKHNIIANSTFSWWGAWLNSNPEKIIVAPKKWFGVDTWDTSDIIPQSWIQL